jgi:site-specific DNA-methyltransferase (adenine-specific)
MKSLPDNAFNLAIVDPPYGIKDFQSKRNTPGRGVQKFQKDWKGLKWDMKPKKEYFDELFRISKNQIIWGANNFILPTTEYFCIWDKQQTVDNFASAEYAWISSNEWKKPAKVFTYSIHQANALKDKIHPTQKPVKLYEWLLSNYAKQGDKILDTHLGSGSHAIACNNLGFELVGLELDSDYFKASCERIAKKAQQERLF